MMSKLNRRRFLKSTTALGVSALVWPLTHCTEGSKGKSKSEGFFTLDQRKNHWWLITPDGKPFFTIGLNHIDPASMRYSENIDILFELFEHLLELHLAISSAPYNRLVAEVNPLRKLIQMLMQASHLLHVNLVRV